MRPTTGRINRTGGEDRERFDFIAGRWERDEHNPESTAEPLTPALPEAWLALVLAHHPESKDTAEAVQDNA